MYTKQTWVDGDVLSSSKLNHIEDGVEENHIPEIEEGDYGGYLGVVADEDNITDAVVIPQQTVTVSSDDGVQVQSNFPNPLPSSCPATMTINGVDYEASYLNNSSVSSVYIESPEQDSPPYYWFYMGSGTSQVCEFNTGDGQGGYVSGTYTVKVILHIPGAKWGIIQETSGGGEVA